MEFSKIVFVLSLVLAIAVSLWGICVFTYAVTCESSTDFGFAIALVGAVYAEFATATGFYYNKAKAENKIKLMKQNGVKPCHDDFENI